MWLICNLKYSVIGPHTCLILPNLVVVSDIYLYLCTSTPAVLTFLEYEVQIVKVSVIQVHLVAPRHIQECSLRCVQVYCHHVLFVVLVIVALSLVIVLCFMCPVWFDIFGPLESSYIYVDFTPVLSTWIDIHLFERRQLTFSRISGSPRDIQPSSSSGLSLFDYGSS